MKQDTSRLLATVSSACCMPLIQTRNSAVRSFFPGRQTVFQDCVSVLEIFCWLVFQSFIVHYIVNCTRLSKLNDKFTIYSYLPTKSFFSCSLFANIDMILGCWLVTALCFFFTRKNICTKRLDSNTTELTNKF